MEWWELGHFTSDLLTITETFEELAEEGDRKSVSSHIFIAVRVVNMM